ncbi:hypothetical protein ES703_25134 [subsurface metagenome]
MLGRCCSNSGINSQHRLKEMVELVDPSQRLGDTHVAP